MFLFCLGGGGSGEGYSVGCTVLDSNILEIQLMRDQSLKVQNNEVQYTITCLSS